MDKKILITLFIFVLIFSQSINVSALDWNIGISYQIGDIVTYNGKEYRCIQSHTSQAGWTPAAVPALWEIYTAPINDGSWQINKNYNIGDKVLYNNIEYINRQAHKSQNDWTPDKTPALWERNIDSTTKNNLLSSITNKYGTVLNNEWVIDDLDKSVHYTVYKIKTHNINDINTIKEFTWIVQE